MGKTMTGGIAPNQQDRGRSPFVGPQEAFHFALRVCGIYFRTLAPFLRYGQGKRAYGLDTWFSFMLLCFFCRSTEFHMFVYAWIILLAWRKLRHDRREHTQFQGYCLLCPFGSERFSHCAEVVMVWLLGRALALWSEDVGAYVSFGVYPLGIKYIFERYYWERVDDGIADDFVNMELRQRRLEHARRKRGL